MKKLISALFFVAALWSAPAYAQFSQQEIIYLKEMMADWLAAGQTVGGGSGHVIQDEGTPLTARANLNFTGLGITCSDSAPNTICNVPAGSVDMTAPYVWTSTHTWRDANFSLLDNGDLTKIAKFELSGISAGTTRTYTLPDASTTLVGIGIANTYGAFAQDFGTATSLKVPTSAGAGPTASGLIAYDSTADTLEWGANGSNKIALADPGSNGFLDRTAVGTTIARTLTGTTNRIVVTNGGGGGVPTFDLGSLAVVTNASATFTTGDFNLAAASSFTFPSTAGAAPTTSGRCAYDTTANRMKCGFNGSTIILATTAETQPLSTNLTSFAALAGVNNAAPIFTAAGTLTTTGIPSCADSAGQHLNYDTTTHTYSCGTSSTGGLSGLTTGTFPIAATATSVNTSGSNLSQSAGVVNASSGFSVGTGPFLIINPSGVTSTDKTWTVMDFSGTIRPSTGAFTAGHVITTDANGLLIDGGVAGAGTWTDSSTSTGTNKTLVATAAGGTNTITTGINASFDGGSLTVDGVNCTAATSQVINSGPQLYAFSCADSNSSTFDGQIVLPTALATATFTLTVNDLDSSAQHFAGGFKAMCRGNGTTVNGTWGTAQTVDITMTTVNLNYSGTTTAVTPNGTCGAGATLFFRFTVDATTHTDAGNARVVNVLMKQAS